MFSHFERVCASFMYAVSVPMTSPVARDDVRCGAVDATTCSSPNTVVTYAVAQSLPLTVPSADFTASTMVILGLATAELRTAPAVLSLDSSRPYAVHTVLARSDQLRSQFAQLGSRAAHSAAS